MSESLSDVGRFIREHRERNGMTQEDLAANLRNWGYEISRRRSAPRRGLPTLNRPAWQPTERLLWGTLGEFHPRFLR